MHIGGWISTGRPPEVSSPYRGPQGEARYRACAWAHCPFTSATSASLYWTAPFGQANVLRGVGYHPHYAAFTESRQTSMCGICGVYNAWSGEPVSPELVERMTHLIAHRGPDDTGAYLDGPAGLGFARLSIIDLDGGHQPMSNETGDVWAVFNGEIWNYKGLPQELTARGHLFRT